MLSIRRVLACSTICLLFSSLTLFAQTTGKKNRKITIKTKLLRSAILPGEPLEVIFEVSNQSNQVISIGGLDIMRGDVVVSIAFEHGQYLRYRGYWGAGSCGPVKMINLKPNQQISATGVIHFNFNDFPEALPSDYAFEKPGHYLLKARYDSYNPTIGYVNSDPVPIQIMEPKGQDAEVWQMIRLSRDIANFITTKGSAFVDMDVYKTAKNGRLIARQLEKIISNYPQSAYSRYIQDALTTYSQQMTRFRIIRLTSFENTVKQAGQFFIKGDFDSGTRRLNSMRDFLARNNEFPMLFPPDLPIEGYIGLAYLMNKEYEKALEYLQPVVKSLAQTEDHEFIRDATIFTLLVLNKENQAFNLLSAQEQPQEKINKLKEQLTGNQGFSCQAYLNHGNR